jgi:hypothetical protein
LELNISPSALSRLSLAAQALCTRIVESKEPYILKTIDEKFTFKQLPKELQHSWLFKSLARQVTLGI